MYVQVNDKIQIYYEEFGEGDRYILSAQIGFYPKGMQQQMAKLGYHVICVTLRGFAPSSHVTEDYGEGWYDVFADDLVAVADHLGIDKFVYMGASHGAGVGWHIMLRHGERVKAFIAVVGGPHSLDTGTMSFKQMLEKGIIKEFPPFNPPIDQDDARSLRRSRREEHIRNLPPAPEEERAINYGRPLLAMKTEENLRKALSTIEVPTLMIGGVDDPISTPELMVRTARCLPHCKLLLYANCGHDIDTDLIEETTTEADRFIQTVEKTGKWYLPVEE
ncbi:MAG: alpha/beta hydrolase [Acetatifactor sp.]|nr:alpha/beta hydrolase [Acetatifactor sp.]